MNLKQARILFSEFISLMPAKAKELGYFWVYDEVTNHQNIGHKPGSLHYEGLACDGILYDENGNYITDIKPYAELGVYWKTLHPYCRYGGDWVVKDSDHFSFAPPEIVGNRE